MEEIEAKQKEINKQLFTPQLNNLEILFVNNNPDKMDEILELGTKLCDEVDANEALVAIIAQKIALHRTVQKNGIDITEELKK